MASSSSSSSALGGWTYEVFLSFRGEDIRKTFVDHLYAALDQRGIYTFKDDERLRGGESISDQLLESIRQSRSAIVIFSNNYASSCWCMDELEKIMECKEKLGQIVFPVFYDIDPSEVRRQTGTFGEGFARAVGRKADKALVWRKALQDAANLSGYDLRHTADGHESQCIKQIVEWFKNNPGNMFPSFDENLIGMKQRVRDLMSLINTDLDDVRMIGIWGMGGSGKTTVARVAFDEISKQFDGVSFIESVREVSQKFGGLQLLQKKMLTNILVDENVKVDSVPQGTQMIRRRLGHKKVLIVLDDVDEVIQLHALAGSRSWFCKGSRILITTRDSQLLVAHGVDVIHGVDLLTGDEAIQLFSLYAFKMSSPTTTKEYDKVSLRVVRYAAGLPLTLKVLGSFLCGRGMAEWTSALQRLAKVPEKKTLEILRISYDGLEDIEKELFLDIACLFKGWWKDEVVRILDSCEFYPVIGISVLVQKSLITISGERFQMHDLIQEMGRTIVSEKHPKEPGRQSRLWRLEDICDVLEKNTGTEAIEAIVLGDDEAVELKCDTKAFRSMNKLRILCLTPFNAASFVLPEYLPNELRWLSWFCYPGQSLPEHFQASKLVGLEMRSNKIFQLWEEKKLLDKLKFLDLSRSLKLIRSPDFSGMPNLQTLTLENCRSLTEIHPSIGHLQRLVSLNLANCTQLVDFPPIIQMNSLEILNFCWCKKFKRFPEVMGNMDRLSQLYLNSTAIEGLPLSIANLPNLVLITFNGCKNLLDLPDTVCMLKYLKTLNLSYCSKLKKLPENLGHMESLKVLRLDGVGVRLPSSIVLSKNLKYVSLSGNMILEESMGYLSCLSFLEELDLSYNQFSFLPFIISQLSHLKVLDLSGCTKLKAIPELPSSIAILKAGKCTSLESIEGLPGNYKWLWTVSLQGCKSLMMHAKCDLCQQDYSITRRRSEWKFSTPFCKSSYCWKHWKSLRELTVGATLLQSMLQGHAVVNHRLSIFYAEKEHDVHTPMWFGQEVKGNQFVLKLPPNWKNKITGFAMCVVCKTELAQEVGIEFIISLSEVQVPVINPKWARRTNYRDVWMGYISLNLLQRATEGALRADWMNTATQLFLTFYPLDTEVKSCAARLVYMEDVDLEVTAHSSSFTCNGSLYREPPVEPNFPQKTAIYWYHNKGSSNGITFKLF